MSCGERSCRWYAKADQPCNPAHYRMTCNVDCEHYKSNGRKPDSVPLKEIEQGGKRGRQYRREVMTDQDKAKHITELKTELENARDVIEDAIASWEDRDNPNERQIAWWKSTLKKLKKP